MAARDDGGAGLGAARVLDGDEVQGVLTGAFYQAPPESARMLKADRDGAKAKPTHYKVICISMYTKDLDRLDGLVDQLYNLWNRNPMQVKASYLSSGGKSDVPVAPTLASY